LDFEGPLKTAKRIKIYNLKNVELKSIFQRSQHFFKLVLSLEYSRCPCRSFYLTNFKILLIYLCTYVAVAVTIILKVIQHPYQKLLLKIILKIIQHTFVVLRVIRVHRKSTDKHISACMYICMYRIYICMY
jgi:hypothetical protein